MLLTFFPASLQMPPSITFLLWLPIVSWQEPQLNKSHSNITELEEHEMQKSQLSSPKICRCTLNVSWISMSFFEAAFSLHLRSPKGSICCHSLPQIHEISASDLLLQTTVPVTCCWHSSRASRNWSSGFLRRKTFPLACAKTLCPDRTWTFL